MFLLHILRVLFLPALFLGAMGYGAFRFVRFLERTFGISAGEPREELTETLERARQVVGRIHGLLPASPEEVEASGVMEREIGNLVEARLPEALERQRRLLDHLAVRSETALVTEERTIQRKLQSARDPELRNLLERNLAMVRARIETRRRLMLASRRADAQIRAVLINLETFEDRLVARQFDTVAAADTQIEALVEDVKLLEAAYDELSLDE